MSPTPEDQKADEAIQFVEDFFHVLKPGQFSDEDTRLEYFDKKYGRSAATTEKKKRFQRVCVFFQSHLDELNRGMALIAGRDVMAMSRPLAFCVYMRLFHSKDGGAHATPSEVLDFYAQLEKEKKG